VTNDHGKKESHKELRVRPQKNYKKEEVSSSSSEEEEDQDDEYVPQSESDHEEDDQSHAGSEADSTTEDEEGRVLSPASSISGLKRKKEVKRSPKDVKRQKTSDRQAKLPKEIKHNAIAKTSEKTAKDDETKDTAEKKGAAGKKEVKVFNDRNVDLDLFHSSPTNVVARKVKVSSNLIVTCRNIDQIEGARSAGVSYDFAALTFQRKTANDKMFEFVVPLSAAPRITEAINHIIEQNKTFFKSLA